MKKTILLLLLTVVSLSSSAYDFLRPVKGQIPGGYNFWVYTPQDYFYKQSY